MKLLKLKFFLIAVFIRRITRAQEEDWACEENFVSIGSSCYYFNGIETLANYTAAIKFCQKMYAGLADYTRNDTVNYLDVLLRSGFSQTPLTSIWVQSTDRMDCRAVNFPTDISRAITIPCSKEAAIVCRKPACEAGTLPRGPVCYWMHSERVTYVEAEKSCRTEKQSEGRLAMVHNAEILEILSRVVKAYQISGSTWLGMNDREVEGVWRYADGTLVRSEDVDKLWLKGEPNGERTENCGAIFGKRWKFLLGDEACNLTYPALCEVDATALSVDFGPFVLLCQKGFRYFDGHCYRLINDRESNYVEAFDHCTSLGSSLSLARSDQTLKFMRALADEVKTGNATYPNGTLVPPLRAWIGMMRDPSSYLNRGNLKTWLWSDGIYQAPDVLSAPNTMVKECPPNIVEWPTAFMGPPKESSRKGCVNFVAADNFYCKLRSESCSARMGYYCQHKACNQGWYPFSINTCLILITSPKSYVNAIKYCEALKSEIVFVTSNRDLQVLRQLFSKLLRGEKATIKKPSSVWIQLVLDDYLSAPKSCFVAKTDSANVTVGDCDEERPFFCQEPALNQPRGKAQQLFESQMLSDGSYLPKDDDQDESTTRRGVTPIIPPTLPTYNITRKVRPNPIGESSTDSSVYTTTDDYENQETEEDNNIDVPTVPGNKRTTAAGGTRPTRKPKPDSSGGKGDSSGGKDKSSGGKGDTSGTNGGRGDSSDGKNDNSGGKGDSSGGKNDNSGGRGDSSNGGSSGGKGDSSNGGSSGGRGDSSGGKNNNSGGKGDSSNDKSNTSGGKGGGSGGKNDNSGAKGDSSGNKGESSSGNSNGSGGKGDGSGGKGDGSGGKGDGSGGKGDGSGGKSGTSSGKGDSSGGKNDNSGAKGDSSGGKNDNSGAKGDSSGNKGESSSGGKGDGSGGKHDNSGSKGESSSSSQSGRPNGRPGVSSTESGDSKNDQTTELSPSWSRTTTNPPRTNPDGSNGNQMGLFLAVCIYRWL